MAMRWYGDQVLAKVRRHLAVRLEYAARTVRDHAREQLGKKRAGTRYGRQVSGIERRIGLAEADLARASAGEALNARGQRRVAGLGGLRARHQSLAAAFGVSAPGDYPSLRTGHLRRNVQMEMDKEALVARVGTNVLYGRFLEFGTRKMRPRPWLSLTLRETTAQVREILEVEVERGGGE